MPFEKQDDFFDLAGKSYSGRINSITFDKNNIYVIYEKGFTEDFMSGLDKDPRKRIKQIESEKQNYLAVFDQSLTLRENDIPLPKGLIYTNIVTEEGEILGLKNQDYFGEEKDQVVYYKLKVIRS